MHLPYVKSNLSVTEVLNKAMVSYGLIVQTDHVGGGSYVSQVCFPRLRINRKIRRRSGTPWVTCKGLLALTS